MQIVQYALTSMAGMFIGISIGVGIQPIYKQPKNLIIQTILFGTAMLLFITAVLMA
jgi:hypothetical protein